MLANRDIVLFVVVLLLLWFFFGRGVGFTGDFSQILGFIVIIIVIYLVFRFLTTGSVELFEQTNKHSVQITDIPPGYSPAELIIKQGDTVRWRNGDNKDHTVTSGSFQFNSGIMKPGATFIHKFTRPGRYDYYCTLHPDRMAGVVYVE